MSEMGYCVKCREKREMANSEKVKLEADAMSSMYSIPGFIEIEIEHHTHGMVLALKEWVALAATGLPHPIARLGFEQVDVRVCHGVIELVQWCKVVNDPKAASLGCHDQIQIADLQIGN